MASITLDRSILFEPEWAKSSDNILICNVKMYFGDMKEVTLFPVSFRNYLIKLFEQCAQVRSDYKFYKHN